MQKKWLVIVFFHILFIQAEDMGLAGGHVSEQDYEPLQNVFDAQYGQEGFEKEQMQEHVRIEQVMRQQREKYRDNIARDRDIIPASRFNRDRILPDSSMLLQSDPRRQLSDIEMHTEDEDIRTRQIEQVSHAKNALQDAFEASNTEDKVDFSDPMVQEVMNDLRNEFEIETKSSPEVIDYLMQRVKKVLIKLHDYLKKTFDEKFQKKIMKKFARGIARGYKVEVGMNLKFNMNLIKNLIALEKKRIKAELRAEREWQQRQAMLES